MISYQERDPSLIIQQAIYTRLTTSPALDSAVYDGIPERHRGIFVYIGEVDLEDWSTKTDYGKRVHCHLHIVQPEEEQGAQSVRTFDPVNTVASQVLAALTDAATPLALDPTTGFVLLDVSASDTTKSQRVQVAEGIGVARRAVITVVCSVQQHS